MRKKSVILTLSMVVISIIAIVIFLNFVSSFDADPPGLPEEIIPDDADLTPPVPEGYGKDIPNEGEIFSDIPGEPSQQEFSLFGSAINFKNPNLIFVFLVPILVILIIIILIILFSRKKIKVVIKARGVGEEVNIIINSGKRGILNKAEIYKNNLKVTELNLCKERVFYGKKVLKYKVPKTWKPGNYSLRIYDLKKKKWKNYFFKIK